MSQSRVFKTLSAINHYVNHEMPNPPNRFEQFEACPRDADQDEVDRLYEIHEKEYEHARSEYYVNEYLNEMVADYVRDKNISLSSDVNDVDKRLLRQFLLSKSETLKNKIKRCEKVLYSRETHPAF